MLRTRRHSEMNMRPVMASRNAMSILVHPSMCMEKMRFDDKILI